MHLFYNFIFFMAGSITFSEDIDKLPDDLKSKIIFLMEKEAEQSHSNPINCDTIGEKIDLEII